MSVTPRVRKRAVIATVQLPETDDVEHARGIAELRRLLKTLGHEVVGVVAQKLPHVRASTILGDGKLRELAEFTGGTGVVPSPATPKRGKRQPTDDDEPPESSDDDDDDESRADLVVIDHEITPRQARNLEKATDAEVLDRSGVIVEIFHRHAHTREARLQVEIARLSYVVPRLRAGVRGHDRQRGGVGGKGAGESALELDRRKVRDRIAQLRAELEAIEREEDRRRVRRHGQRRVGLVGYTNAGKSSLMRALTHSGVLVEDKLFATLGTTVRALQPEVNPRLLVSDTVGFIDRLPHALVASFRSTLAEALEASLLLYVADCSDPGFRSQLRVTRRVLAEIGADSVPSQLVLNKIDKLDALDGGGADAIEALRAEFPDAILMCAHKPEDVAALRIHIIEKFEAALDPVELFVPYSKSGVIGDIRGHTRVLSESHDELGTHFTVKAPPEAIDRVRARLGG